MVLWGATWMLPLTLQGWRAGDFRPGARGSSQASASQVVQIRRDELLGTQHSTLACTWCSSPTKGASVPSALLP